MDYILVAAGALIGGLTIGYLVRKFLSDTKVSNAMRTAEGIIEEAEKEAQQRKKEALLDAEREAIAERKRLEAEAKEQRKQIEEERKKLSRREDTLDTRTGVLDKREQEVTQREKEVEKAEKIVTDKDRHLDEQIEEQKRQLERIAGLSRDEAKQILLNRLEEDVKTESALIIKRLQEETKATAKRKAQEILISAIQRIATDHVSEVSVSSVPLPSEDLKGRIIGREGRNIRAFEAITGVNLIIDDTPDTVVLSGFDPVRREMARQTLERLLMDGRIHPGRIEEIYSKVVREIDDSIIEAGENAALEAGVADLKLEILKVLGRLKYRTSFGQNVLKHSIEVSHLCGALADELGVNDRIARRAGLLHDIGKGLAYEPGGTHAITAGEFCRRHGESPAICHAVAAHHQEEEPSTIEAWLVLVGDAISAARPGARRETIDTYLRRLEALETIARSFQGVEKCFAIHAGREIRILVEPEDVDDLEAIKMARDISLKIEQEMEYPGQIKVTVVRETRAVEYAK